MTPPLTDLDYLERLLDALEREWVDGSDGTFVVPDHYAARLPDFLDLLASAWRAARRSISDISSSRTRK